MLGAYDQPVPFGVALTSEAALREHYPPPGKPSVAKEVHRLDDNCRAFIAHSPFLVLATTDGEGNVDASPKGGPPGFVTVLDDTRLAIPDLSGNNRLDSLSNLVANSGIALLFVVPGLDWTLRVNGCATITMDPDVLDACALAEVRPNVAIGVDVATAYLHCAKSFQRGAVWKPENWPDLSDLPRIACMLRDHYDLPDLDVDAVEKRLSDGDQYLWKPSGVPRT